MAENQTPSSSSVDKAYVADREVTFYFREVRWPIIVGIIAGGAAVSARAPIEVVWAIYLVIFAYIGWHLFKVERATLAQGLVAGAFAGALIGIIVAIIRLIVFWEFYTFFNIITDPILNGVVGAGVVALTVWVLNQHLITTKKTTKGGGRNARRKTSRK